jgi:F-type H+-transporting ATPase subunit delta
MAELATIARPYAEALFKAAKSDLAGTSVWLDAVAAVAANPQLQQFASNPQSGGAQVFDLLTSVAKVTLPEQGKNFCNTVIDNGRVNALPEIAAQFRALKNAQSGTADATVFSAFPIDGAALADVSALMEKRFGRKLNLQVALQPELIGGIRVVVGDEVLDTSVKARLEQMKVALTA